MRPATAHIRLDAFRHNYRLAKQLHGSKALAVVKANAYGHGAVHCAKAIAAEADGFAVAAIEEALQLRQAGITNPILLLEGFFEAAELPVIAANGLWIVIHHAWQVDMLLASRLPKPLQVWLKLDSGMHRVGLAPSEYAAAYARLCRHANVEHIVLMSHFANADDVQSQHTLQQLDIFRAAVGGAAVSEVSAPIETSLANSAAILGWPQTHASWARPGILLYGASPIPEQPAGRLLRPVMQLASRIISTRNIKKGESIGYGSIFTASRDTVVGVVACGYADGYPRAATGTSSVCATSLNAPAAVDGKMTTLIGRVSMDMLFVDLTDIPGAHIGSHVELWGDQVFANDVATAAGTIAYELFCNVKRVHFEYTDNV